MESIDQLGIFWLAQNPDDKLTGRLIFDPSDRAVQLSLVGIFSAVVPAYAEIRIFGWIGSDPVTIDGAFNAGSDERSSGVSESRYRGNRMFKGYHLDAGQLQFASTRIVFSDLNTWVGVNGATWERIAHVPDGAAYRIEYATPERQSARFSRGTVALTFGSSFRTDPGWKVGVKEQIAIRLDYDSEQPIDGTYLARD